MTSIDRFTSKERDAETGLDYFGARYMSAAQGRFTSPDPYNLGARLRNPQSWNMYGYVQNNPLSRIDPNGLWTTSIHRQITERAFPGLSPTAREVLHRISRYQDRFAGGQTRSRAEEHAMRAPNWTVQEAREKFANFIQKELNAAQIAQGGASDISLNALEAFGALLHAVQDETSPAHEGFQVWDYNTCLFPGVLGVLCSNNSQTIELHHSREKEISSDRMDRAIGESRQWFQRTFGLQLYLQAIGERSGG